MPVSSFFNPLEFAQSFAKKISEGYKTTDKALGGWLPGGGTASPITPSIRRFAERARDQVVIPAIDEGIRSGVLPTKETMFARYLTGTSKPLTAYPAPLVKNISDAYNQTAIDQTRDTVNQIYKQENPLYRQFSDAQRQYFDMQKSIRDRAVMRGVQASPQETEMLNQLGTKTNTLRQSLGLPGTVGSTEAQFGSDIPPGALTDQARLDTIKRHNLASPENISVGFNAAYGNALPKEVRLSLGRFNIKDSTIQDRYDFNQLEAGRQNVREQSVYPSALGGGEAASNLIELGLKTGIINPKSGYDVRIPLSQ
jgi:hypothetical protein